MDGPRPDAYKQTVFTEVVRLLRRAAEWEVSQARWSRIDGVLAAMESSFAVADPWTALDEEAAELELLGPPRVSTRLGDLPEIPAPPEVRERINKLISRLMKVAETSTAGDQPMPARSAEPEA